MMNDAPGFPRWHSVTLRVAAVYNIAWGLFAILEPQALFRLCRLDPLPNYPEFWQCIGMIVGVYGIGYGIAAGNPVRHWPVVLVGLIGKVLGPIGFVKAALDQRLPWAMGLTILTNDLIWWVPFSCILLHAARQHQGNPGHARMESAVAAGQPTSGVGRF